MRKKLVSVLLAALLCVAMLPLEALATSSDDIVSGKIRIGAVNSYEYSFDANDLTTGDNTRFSKSLAQTAALLACDVNDNGAVRLGGSANGSSDAVNVAADSTGTLLSDLGFGNIKVCDIRNEKLGDCIYDTVGYTMARRVVKKKSRSYVVYLLSVRATFAPSEWRSNIDIGAESDEYAKQYGYPSEWTDKSQHKGFAVAANRVTERFDRYIESFAEQDSKLQKSAMITGHSRGAAVSNLIGKEFEDRYNSNKEIKPYTYTIAPPAVVVDTAENCGKYRTIYNIVNEDDLVTCIPLKDWGFKIYGKTYSFSMRKNESLRNLWDSEQQSLVLRAFAKEYMKSLRAEIPSFRLLPSLLKKNKKQAKPFETIDAQKLAKAINNVFISPDSAKNRSRNSFYEYSDTVWIPKDISEEYSRFYIDAPYDPDKDHISKALFNRLSKKYNCKRVKVSPMFMWTGTLRLIENLRDDPTYRELVELQQIAEEAKDQSADCDTEEAREELILKLLKKATTSEDLKVLLSVVFVKSGMTAEKINYYADNILDMVSNLSLRGVLCAHMPVTYYFAIQNDALY